LHRTYMFRIYPTKAQEMTLCETIETCRRTYNSFLDDKTKNGTGFKDQRSNLSRRRKEDKYLKKVHSQVLQNISSRLQLAFQSYDKGITGYPRFKRTGKYNSFTYPQATGFALSNGRLRLAFVGRVRIRQHREVPGKIKTCTVVRRLDCWYAGITTEIASNDKGDTLKLPIGLDLGIHSVVTLSDGTQIPGPRFLAKRAARLRTLQRSLSRKCPNSNNREKARLKFARAWRKVGNQRMDFAHKLSRLLADNYSPIFFEDLDIRKMTGNRQLASAILDSCWGMLRRLTASKAESCNGRVMLVDPRWMSQKCSRCGSIENPSHGTRTFSCRSCGLVLDRDINAAKNILKMGLERARVEAGPLPTPRVGKSSL